MIWVDPSPPELSVSFVGRFVPPADYRHGRYSGCIGRTSVEGFDRRRYLFHRRRLVDVLGSCCWGWAAQRPHFFFILLFHWCCCYLPYCRSSTRRVPVTILPPALSCCCLPLYLGVSVFVLVSISLSVVGDHSAHILAKGQYV